MTATLHFVKMSGSGNDFVLVDNRSGAIPEEKKADLARALCPRSTAVGADGLILVEESASADVRMRILNADGTEPAMCGNGSRCFAYWVRELGAAGPEMTIETLAGPIAARVEGATVRVELTRPREVESRGKLTFAGERREVYFTDTGVPHAVVFVGSGGGGVGDAADAMDVDAVPVKEWGRALRFHDAFQPTGANANFVKVVSPGRISLRTYERGVEDETLACGTGATAAAIVTAHREGWPSPVQVAVRSGETLTIHFRGEGPAYEAAMLEGAVDLVYRGEVETDLI